ncbi:hypothetical protein B0H13DRAFT_2327736 [Mycena leptocephala]|nr:hypothetical protein B0H13DRAFT_2327736 [Mycena leptocephala]
MRNFFVLLVSTLGLLIAWTRPVLPLLINVSSWVERAMLFPQTVAAPSTLLVFNHSLHLFLVNFPQTESSCYCFASVDVNGLLTISPHKYFNFFMLVETLKLQQCSSVVRKELAPYTPGPTFRTAPSPGSNSVWWFAGLATATSSCVHWHRTTHGRYGSARTPRFHTPVSSPAPDLTFCRRLVRSQQECSAIWPPPRSYGAPVATVNDFAETTPTPTTVSVIVEILPKVASPSLLFFY